MAGCVAPVRTRSLFSSVASDCLHTQRSWPSLSRTRCKGTGRISTQQRQGKTPNTSWASYRQDFSECPLKESVGTRRQEETLHGALLLTCSHEEVNLFVWHFQSLLCVYIKKGQPRLWAQTEGARKWLIRVYMKHQLMTGTQGTSIMPLPWELHQWSYICLCIHRLPPWYFFPFPRHCLLPWCHATSLGKEHHCWARWITLGWGEGQEWAETSWSALYFKVDQAHAENSALLSEQKMRDLLPLQADACKPEQA